MLLGLQLVRLGFWLALSGGWVSSASNTKLIKFMI